MGRSNQTEETGPKKISLPLDAEGGIDWESVRPSVREKFLSVVQDDVTTLEHIGMRAPSTADGMDTGETELDLGITQEDIHEALDELMTMESAIFRVVCAKWLKHPLARDREGKPVPLLIDADIAAESFKLTEKQHKNLDARVTRQVKRIPIPEWMKKHFDLWMIGIYLTKSSLANAQTAMKEQIRRDIARSMAAQARAAASPPHNPKPDSDLQPPVGPVPTNGHASEGESLEPEAAASPGMPPPGAVPDIPEAPLV